MPGATPATEAVELAAAAGRLLPLDAPFAETTLEDLASGRPWLPAGPRQLGYGPPSAWLQAKATLPPGLSCWRTVAVPEAAGLVFGVFSSQDMVLDAESRLEGARPEGRESLVAVEWLDARTARWILGPHAGQETDPGGPRAVAMLARLEGDREAVARGVRTAWQSMELAGAGPRRFATAPINTAPIHPELPEGAAILAFAAEPESVPGLYTDIVGAAELLGAIGARAWPGLGALFAYLPPHPRQAEAVAWLRERAVHRGGRACLLAPASDPQAMPDQGDPA